MALGTGRKRWSQEKSVVPEYFKALHFVHIVEQLSWLAPQLNLAMKRIKSSEMIHTTGVWHQLCLLLWRNALIKWRAGSITIKGRTIPVSCECVVK